MQCAMIPLVLFSFSGQVDGDTVGHEPDLIRQESLENLPLQPVDKKSAPPEPKRSEHSMPQRIADNLLQPEVLRKVGSSLALVIGVFLIFTILGRLASPKHGSSLELVRVLGKVSISSKHQLHIVQFHQRILLLGETQNGLECFEKIDDPNLVSEINSIRSANFESLKSSEADRLLSLIKEQRSRLEGDDEKLQGTRKSYVA